MAATGAAGPPRAPIPARIPCTARPLRRSCPGHRERSSAAASSAGAGEAGGTRQTGAVLEASRRQQASRTAKPVNGAAGQSRHLMGVVAGLPSCCWSRGGGVFLTPCGPSARSEAATRPRTRQSPRRPSGTAVPPARRSSYPRRPRSAAARSVVPVSPRVEPPPPRSEPLPAAGPAAQPQRPNAGRPRRQANADRPPRRANGARRAGAAPRGPLAEPKAKAPHLA